MTKRWNWRMGAFYALIATGVWIVGLALALATAHIPSIQKQLFDVATAVVTIGLFGTPVGFVIGLLAPLPTPADEELKAIKAELEAERLGYDKERDALATAWVDAIQSGHACNCRTCRIARDRVSRTEALTRLWPPDAVSQPTQNGVATGGH